MELVDCDMNIHGMAVMAHKGINDPVYVSVGHRVSLKTAVEIVTLCSVYRVP
jgi:deoxyribonuclease V